MLLSLVNSIKIHTYNYGEYIVREGEKPKGLYIITGGQAIVASSKVSMRSTLPHQFSRFPDSRRRWFFTSVNSSPTKKDKRDQNSDDLKIKPLESGAPKIIFQNQIVSDDKIDK